MHNVDTLKFVECDECASKPGSPTLCDACLRNRCTIHTLQRQLQQQQQKQQTRKNTDYIVYEWHEVKDALNNCIRAYNPSFFIKNPNMDYVKDIYNDDIKAMIRDLFVQYFTLNKNRYSETIQILINAQKQINDVGYVGSKDMSLLFTRKPGI